MSVSAGYQQPTAGYRPPVQRTGGGTNLAEVLEVVLDKGIVIDAWARVSVIGIEILTIEARVVVASVETYLRYAEAIGLTALAAAPPSRFSMQESNGAGEIDQDEILGFLSDHPEGLRLGEMEAYFNQPRKQLADTVESLVEDEQVRYDEEHNLYYAEDEGSNN